MTQVHITQHRRPVGRVFATDEQSLLAQQHNQYAHPNEPDPPSSDATAEFRFNCLGVVTLTPVELCLSPTQIKLDIVADVYIVQCSPILLNLVKPGEVPGTTVGVIGTDMKMCQ